MKQRVKQSGLFILMLCLGLSLGVALKHAYTKLSFHTEEVTQGSTVLHLAQPEPHQTPHFNFRIGFSSNLRLS
ncbi:hypothetical protein CWB99_03145 [Pseudoalteromonas rubra]|uniref:Uncharacterized protein n=1 Tax=Pseudoalteromonas rubra TaxID=43658 RepID=A0A5S3WTK2_9GAMM|nr:hypothetical protein [Pseudoalteromonas rubra]TMP30161.1 hypothetical protein CWC00_17340 [Pseudoalteromonas rubra]TMP31971.1 hypothetical protein CWB99_03145 [Pseudoalteromonas rubra]